MQRSFGLWRISVWLGFCLSVFVSGGMALDLRCHCNLPVCVGTSYMCRSTVGCFQELPTGQDFGTARPRHGCLELWPLAQKLHCVPELRRQKLHSGDFITPIPTAHIKRKSHSTRRNADVHQLRCCTEDMCNYVQFDNTEWSMSNSKLNSIDNIGGSLDLQDNLSPTQLVATHSDSTVWMKAALIAVPLAGTLILLLLVMVACWLLKFDLKYLSDSSHLLQEEKRMFLSKKPPVTISSNTKVVGNDYSDVPSLGHSTTSLKAKLINSLGGSSDGSQLHQTEVRRIFCPSQPHLLPWKTFTPAVSPPQPTFTTSRHPYDFEAVSTPSVCDTGVDHNCAV